MFEPPRPPSALTLAQAKAQDYVAEAEHRRREETAEAEHRRREDPKEKLHEFSLRILCLVAAVSLVVFGAFILDGFGKSAFWYFALRLVEWVAGTVDLPVTSWFRRARGSS
jgi:hypothetical protein